MTALRSSCIEAMARAWVEYEGDEWDDLNAPGMAAVKACVEREFDALLSTLTEHPPTARLLAFCDDNGWSKDGHEVNGPDISALIAAFLAVLAAPSPHNP